LFCWTNIFRVCGTYLATAGLLNVSWLVPHHMRNVGGDAYLALRALGLHRPTNSGTSVLRLRQGQDQSQTRS
jgi:hypothetical protein